MGARVYAGLRQPHQLSRAGHNRRTPVPVLQLLPRASDVACDTGHGSGAERSHLGFERAGQIVTSRTGEYGSLKIQNPAPGRAGARRQAFWGEYRILSLPTAGDLSTAKYNEQRPSLTSGTC